MDQHPDSHRPEAAADEPASSFNYGDSRFPPPPDEKGHPPCAKVTVPSESVLTDFEPVPLRYRRDGLTPEKQREYVEALAECGVARRAAERIGVSEQAIARVRLRADAQAFDLACEAAQRIGARKIRSVAYERAIEGTVRRHYYHGELKSEEVVYDNRLLIYLLGKTSHLTEPPEETQVVLDDWEGWMEAIEQGLPEPPEPDEDEEEEEDVPVLGDRISIWDQDGRCWTDFPPPAGFDGEEVGAFSDSDYRRTLSEAEQAVVDGWDASEQAERLAQLTARRDLCFGFAGGSRDEAASDAGSAEAGLFSPREAETYETSADLGPDRTDDSESVKRRAGSW